MFKTFYPDLNYESAYDIDYAFFRRAGFENVIFDIDNTLVPHGAPADERAVKLIKSLHDEGFKVLFLSNNKEPRVKSFADSVGSLYVYKAGKPSKKGFMRALDALNGTVLNTMFVGDQLFTDIWGAKSFGLLSILVGKIDKKEEIQIVIKRILEKPIIHSYKKNIRKMGFPVVLTGFMGAGKTTVAKELAALLTIPYIDLDKKIEESEGRSIPDIFKTEGEVYFREKEYEMLKKYSEGKFIIATGGGVVTNEKSVKILKSLKSVYYLNSDFDILFERIRGDGNRPLSQDYESTKARFLSRENLYLSTSKEHVNCNGKSVSDIAREILRRMHEDTGC